MTSKKAKTINIIQIIVTFMMLVALVCFEKTQRTNAVFCSFNFMIVTLWICMDRHHNAYMAELTKELEEQKERNRRSME